jgi:serine/threonine protein kinase
MVEHRKGSLVIQIVRDGQLCALKALAQCTEPTRPEPQLGRDSRARQLRHETVVVGELGELAGDLYRDHGELSDLGPWLLLRWLDATPMGNIARLYREADPQRNSTMFFVLFSRMVKAFAAVHDAGYLHRDVKPSHVLFVPGKIAPGVLDWGLAHSPHGNNFPYPGGHVHYVPTECAMADLSGCDDLPYDLPSEVYALGATMYTCYVGETPVDYGPPPVSLRDQIVAVSRHRLRGFPDPISPRDEAMQAIILRCLSRRPQDRYGSAHDLYQALQFIIR